MGKRTRRLGVQETARVLLDAGSARFAGNDPRARTLVELVADGGPALPGRAAIAREIDLCLVDLVAGAWTRGWQPADIPRLARHRMGEAEARLLIDVIGVQARSYAAGADAPRASARWIAQLDELGAAVGERAHPLLLEWSAEWEDSLWVGAGAFGLLAHLPTIPILIEPPGASGHHRPLVEDVVGIDSRVLAKVRALLAKAESTQFEAEAEALSAKAQELMARHSLDRAVVEAGAGGGAAPIGHRVGVEAPYVGAKVHLLSQVASANRSQSIWSRDLRFCTIIGFDSDVQATELLYTSLLVQADTAMRMAGSVRDRAGRSRTRSFRQSFLLGFVTRIGERLRTTTEATTEQAESEHGASLLPALRSRSAQVEDAAAAAFPDQVRQTAHASSYDGFHAGRLAADQASVNIARSSLKG